MKQALAALALFVCAIAPAHAQSVYRATGEGFEMEIEAPRIGPGAAPGRVVGVARDIGSFEIEIAPPPLARTPTWNMDHRLFLGEGLSLRIRSGACAAEDPARPDRIVFTLHQREFSGCAGETSEPLLVVAAEDFTLAMHHTRFVFTHGGETVSGVLHEPSYPAYFGEDYSGEADDGRAFHAGFRHEGCREEGRPTHVSIWLEGLRLEACIPGP